MKKQAWQLLLAAALLLCSTAFVHAQGVTTGAITGVVTDQSGAAVADAEVVVRNMTTGYTSRGITRANGLFLIQGLEVGGPYTVTVNRIGFAASEQPGIYVRLSQSTRVDVQLATQAVRLDELAVTTARTADFSPTRQGVSVQISDTLVARMPTFSRDFVDLIKLAPQVVFPATGAASGGGAYNRFNTITIDGTNQSERFNLAGSGGVPGGATGNKIVPLDAVKEFRVMFTPADVRQGNFSGMLVNAVTKNGENRFTGGGSFTYRTNADFIGLEMVGQTLRESEFNVKQYAFHVGGPIIRDRLHFFIAPEFQQRTRPAIGPYYLNGTASTEIVPSVPLDSLARIASIMENRFDVGSTGPVDNDNPVTNLFGRLDFQISPAHRLVLRQIINRAEDGAFFRNINTLNNSALNQNSGFRLGSNQFQRVAKNNSTVAQLYSNLSNGMSNELLVGYSTIVDEREVPVEAPEIAVGVNVGGTRRAVTFGTEQFSPGNLLEQDIFEVVNNFTIPFGNHTVTVGGRFDHTSIYNNFAQGTYGVYTFLSIDSLQAGLPSSYAVGYANSRNAGDIPADFGVQMYSLYAQDQWSVNDRLTLTGGLRVDMPRLLDKPSQNAPLSDTLALLGLNRRTDAVPGTSVLFSPRFGFNFDPRGDLSTQIRGSVGVYTGPPPYILLGNAYSNTGLGLVRLFCSGAATPAFETDIDNLPTACAGGTPPAAGQAGTVGINTVDPDFKYPQYFGTSLGFDYRLPYNTVLTVEGMYRKAINGVLITDANIRGARMNGDTPFTDRDGRVMYADAISTTGSVNNNNQRYLLSFRGTSFSEGIIEVTNQSKDYNYSISSQLNRRFSDRLEATVAYTYMKSEDVQSLGSDRAISNWRNGRQLSNAHEDLTTATSVFSRPHRFLAYGTYTMPWELTSMTLYYEGSSGVPFAYVTADDLNGDGYNGNDLIYVPNDATDPAEIQIGAGFDGAFVQNADAAEAFERFIDGQDCLNKQRGSIMKRNSCRSPFQHRFDLSIRQAIPQIRSQQVSLQLDVFNVLNAVGSLVGKEDWGENKLPTLSPAFPDQRALDATARNSGPLDQSIPTFTFDNRLYQSDPTKANYLSPLPFEGATGTAYQVQLTLRYSF